MKRFGAATPLAIGAPDFIARQFNFTGVNHELGPWIHMSAPREWRERPILEAPANELLFVSRISLFGVIPIDLHRIGFNRVLENGFEESSNSLLMKRWIHKRYVNPRAGGSEVVDEVEFSCRVPLLEPFVLPIYRRVFDWRHRRLRIRYGPKP